MSEKVEIKKDETTAKGTWWLPEKPDRKLLGEITYGPISGAKLETYDYFFADGKFGPFTVWGETLSGTPITLFKCYTKSLNMHLPGGRAAKMSSIFGVIGGHFKDPSEIQFIQVTTKITHLHAWSCVTGLSFNFQETSNSVHIDQKCPPEIELGESNGIRLKLEPSCKFTPNLGEFILKEDCALTLQAPSMTTFDGFDKLIRRVQQFLSLAVGRAAYVLEVSGKTDKPKDIIEKHEIFEEYQIIRKLSKNARIEEQILPYEMLFNYGDIQTNPSRYFKNFFDKQKLLEPVCSLFFATFYDPDMFVRQRFLSLAHAVEAYHRAFVGGKYQSDAEYGDGLQKLLGSVIPQTISPDFKESLKNKLKYLHEFSLRKRLQDICLKFESLIKPHVGDINIFAKAVADERNRLTHLNSDAGEDWKLLWLMSEQLSYLLEICLLDEIGFEEETLTKILQNNQHLRAIQMNR